MRLAVWPFLKCFFYLVVIAFSVLFPYDNMKSITLHRFMARPREALVLFATRSDEGDPSLAATLEQDIRAMVSELR
jgi:hypothetical protein